MRRCCTIASRTFSYIVAEVSADAPTEWMEPGHAVCFCEWIGGAFRTFSDCRERLEEEEWKENVAGCA